MTYRPFREGSSRFLLTVNVLAWAAAMAAAPGVVAAQESGEGPQFEDLKRLELPEEIARASDVRWLADGELVLGVIGRGLYSWRVGEKAGQLRVALEEPAADVLNVGGRAVVNSNRYERDYGRLAVSPDGMAFTDLFSGIHLATEDGIDSLAAMEHVGDLDRRGSLTAAIGLVRKDSDGWAEHAAWLIHDGEPAARGLMPTRDGGRSLELCSVAELSVIRFISEDRLLVIPGAEPGVFVYDREGAFLDSLDAETFFAEGGCDVEANEWGRSPLNDAYARADWLGQRRLIDEVVADGEGNVFFFVRYAADDHSGGLADSRQNRALDAISLLGVGAGWLAQQPPGLKGPRQLPPQEPDKQPGRTVTSTVAVRGGALSDSIVASVPPPTGRVCWDLVHARVDDLRAVTRQSCVVESEFADTRLRADLRGDRVVILLRGGALRGADVRSAEAFEARVRPPPGLGD